MKCQKVHTCLSQYCDGNLSSDLAYELEVHLKDCKSCEQEKIFQEQIITATGTLPTKKLADSFNLELMNRIYAEQNNPSESYLPSLKPSFFQRPLGWVSAVAVFSLCAVLTFVMMKSPNQQDNLLQTEQMISKTEPSPAVTFSSVQAKVPIHTYADIIGVSGATSNYRATSLKQNQVLRLTDSKVESLFVALQDRMQSGRSSGLKNPNRQNYRLKNKYSNSPNSRKVTLQNASGRN